MYNSVKRSIVLIRSLRSLLRECVSVSRNLCTNQIYRMRIKQRICIMICCSLLASCNVGETKEVAAGLVEVAFKVQHSQLNPTQLNIRSGGLSTEADIQNIDLLLFDESDRFMKRLQVERSELTTTDAGVSFSVRLDATANRRTIHLVANGRTANGATDRLNFADLTVGMQESVAIPLLRTASLSGSTGGSDLLLTQIMPLVMWGRTRLDGITVVTQVDDVKLLRAAASIQVRSSVNTFQSGFPGTWEIQGIAAHQGAGHGFLTPTNYANGATTPTLARPASDNPYLDYSKTWSNSVEGQGTLYVYERNCSTTDYMSIIVSSLSSESGVSYYKIALVDNQGNPINIVRNHRYILTITGVAGPGTDLSRAVALPPSNALQVELIDQDVEFPCVVADSQYTMALSNNRFDLYGSATDVEIATVYSSRGIQPQFTHSGTSWCQLTASSLGGNKYRITGRFIGGTDASYATTVYLHCYNLTQELQMTWNPAISVVRDADSYVLDLLQATDRNWEVNVVAPTSNSWVYLHPTAATASTFSGVATSGDGMVTKLSSKYHGNAYLHIASGGGGRKAEIYMSASNSRTAISRRVIISQ